ncbi:adhesion G protein-coupled receptor E1-like [Dendronephthya gigantea]|uniref:adhesion G protein-coupled receptor E1-like n=1 Tax=Dendronephthya gigantea TaxID=151771 RepID=UPI00106CB1F5|nr:adhesion G protein-coupled receptor E1-like [Dendronephthya gigantea]
MVMITRPILLFVFMSCVSQNNASHGCPKNWENFGNSCYTFVHIGKSWQNSNSDCENKGGQLARVSGKKLNRFLHEMYRIAKSGINLWIGLKRCSPNSAQWCYPNKKLANYTNWAPDIPDENGDCVEMLDIGVLGNRPCSDKRPYVCEMDFDECMLETHRCHSLATCNNTIGSYTCTCNQGFTGNGTICEDFEECILDTHRCHSHAKCKNTIGSYTCTCNEGFTGNGSFCEDFDECMLETHRCHSRATCNNTIGSYTCTCNQGFTGNGTICEDFVECILDTHRCHSHAKCKNTIGSYTCTCNEGFTGNGSFCEDFDECMLETHRCHSRATCNNTIGSYTCTCNQGFTGNGTICEDFEECILDTHRCHSHAKCKNTIGSYTCTCNEGFTGNGSFCEDFDECMLETHRCHSRATCNNTIGSYTCTCNQGFTGNGTICEDFEECILDTHRCHSHAKCKNTIGSYTCTCNEGFTGNGSFCEGLRLSFFLFRLVVPKVNNTNMEDRLRKLNEQVDELYGMNLTARKKSAQIIIKELSNITNVNNENGVKVIMNPNFLSRTVAILQKVVGLNISDGSVNILGPASNILDEVNRKYWRNMTDERLIRDLVITLQNYGFQLGEVLKNDRSSSRIFQNHSNVQLYVTYQKRSELSPQNSLFNFPNSSFTLSPDALSNDCGAVIVVVWYKTLNLVLRKSGFNGDYHAIKSRIIIASVQPEPRMPFKEPVRISWDATELDEAITCGYWKPELGVS